MDKNEVIQVLTGLESADPEHRKRAINAVYRMPRMELALAPLPHLLRAADDDNPRVRQAIVRSLAFQVDYESIRKVLQIESKSGWRSGGYEVYRACKETLDEVKEEAVPEFLHALLDEDDAVRASAAAILGWFKCETASVDLLRTLTDRDGGVRYAAAGGAVIGDASAVPAITSALGDHDAVVRYAAAGQSARDRRRLGGPGPHRRAGRPRRRGAPPPPRGAGRDRRRLGGPGPYRRTGRRRRRNAPRRRRGAGRDRRRLGGPGPRRRPNERQIRAKLCDNNRPEKTRATGCPGTVNSTRQRRLPAPRPRPGFSITSRMWRPWPLSWPRLATATCRCAALPRRERDRRRLGCPGPRRRAGRRRRRGAPRRRGGASARSATRPLSPPL